MNKGKNVGRKDNMKSDNKSKDDSSKLDIREIEKSADENQASLNEAEKKGGNKDIDKSIGDIRAAIQSFMELTEIEQYLIHDDKSKENKSFSSPSEKGKKVQVLSKDSLVSISSENGDIYSVCPFIFMTDASTQTDLVPEDARGTKLVSQFADTLEIKTGSSSSLCLTDQDLQSISEDFVTSLKISNQKFEDAFMKCFTCEK